jgi:Tfp pilus assembly protein PilO
LFRYMPLHKKAKALEQAKAAQALVIAKASAQSVLMAALEEKLQKQQIAVGKFEANVPSDRNIGEFLQQIAGLMNKHNLKEQIVQPGEEVKTDELNCIPIVMRCKGQLKQIFEFYKSLQAMDRLIRIEKVDLANDSDFSGEVGMETRAVIYYRPQKS